jgi:hypothetical protein
MMKKAHDTNYDSYLFFHFLFFITLLIIPNIFLGKMYLINKDCKNTNYEKSEICNSTNYSNFTNITQNKISRFLENNFIILTENSKNATIGSTNSDIIITNSSINKPIDNLNNKTTNIIENNSDINENDISNNSTIQNDDVYKNKDIISPPFDNNILNNTNNKNTTNHVLDNIKNEIVNIRYSIISGFILMFSILTAIYPTWLITKNLIYAMIDFERRRKLLEIISEIVNINTTAKRQFHLINITHYETLIYWYTLRNIFMNYGKRFTDRLIIQVTIFCVFVLISIIMIIFIFLGYIQQITFLVIKYFFIFLFEY